MKKEKDLSQVCFKSIQESRKVANSDSISGFIMAGEWMCCFCKPSLIDIFQEPIKIFPPR